MSLRLKSSIFLQFFKSSWNFTALEFCGNKMYSDSHSYLPPLFLPSWHRRWWWTCRVWRWPPPWARAPCSSRWRCWSRSSRSWTPSPGWRGWWRSPPPRQQRQPRTDRGNVTVGHNIYYLILSTIYPPPPAWRWRSWSSRRGRRGRCPASCRAPAQRYPTSADGKAE